MDWSDGWEGWVRGRGYRMGSGEERRWGREQGRLQGMSKGWIGPRELDSLGGRVEVGGRADCCWMSWSLEESPQEGLRSSG